MDWLDIFNAICAIIWGVWFVFSLHMAHNRNKVDAIYLALASLICIFYFLRNL